MEVLIYNTVLQLSSQIEKNYVQLVTYYCMVLEPGGPPLKNIFPRGGPATQVAGAK